MKRTRLQSLGILLGVVVLLFWALAPVYWVMVSSISNHTELYSRPYKHWFPYEPTLQNYIDLFTSGPKFRAGSALPSRELLLSGLRNSVILSLSSALIITFLASIAGYAFARLRFRAKELLFNLIVLLVPLPIWVGLVALYFVLSQIGLLDSLVGMILLFVAYGVPLYMWLMRTFIAATPIEIEEAALVDGCTRWMALWRVVLPLALPGLTSVFLVAFLTTWNAFLIPFVFSNSQASQPLTVVLTLFIGQYEVAWESMSAAAVLVMLPPMLMAVFFQRYLVRGLSLGAVK